MGQRSSQPFNAESIEGIYRAIQHDVPEAHEAKSLLALRHWFHELADFDERTGEAIPRPLGAVCARLTTVLSANAKAYSKDRFHRAIEHIRQPLPEVFRRLNERLIREQAMMPVHAVRELDSACFAALSRRPGRTIREKLAGRPYLLAVRRRATVDTAENRLLKALCMRLAELLRVRAECFGEREEPANTEVLRAIEAWLHAVETDEIRRWENFPPNNALLQHRNYRRIWNAWLWTQALDSDTKRDYEQRALHWARVLFWAILSRIRAHPGVRIPEQPCYFDYDAFDLRPGLTTSGVLASTHGLLLPTAPPGHDIGIVSKMEPGKNGQGHGVARMSDGRAVLFHSTRFVPQSDFARVHEGTVLIFALTGSAGGALTATQASLQDAATRINVEMTASLNIRLTMASDGRSVCAEVGQPNRDNVPVKVGPNVITVKMSPQGAITAADVVLSNVLPGNIRPPSVTAPAAPRSSKHAVVDLAALRPRYADDDGDGVMPFRLLWQLWQQPDQDAVEIDLIESRAVSLSADAKTVSILDLLGTQRDHKEDGVLSQAARAFAREIYGFFRTESLTYLVPDAADDFSLETIRANLNARFPNAEPLPRSIAAVFEWHGSPDFQKCDIRAGDCVILLDAAVDALCATPVIACHSSELAQKLPNSRGIFWERCPSVQAESSLSSVESCIRALKQCGCSFSQEVGALCGLRGVLDERDGISWVSEGQVWFTAPETLDAACRAATAASQKPWEGLARDLAHHLSTLTPKAQVFIMTVGDTFDGIKCDRPPLAMLGRHQAIWLGHCPEPTHGGMVLHKWQAAVAHIPLWRDHLPELSIRIVHGGRYQLFHLVKDVTVTPKRGAAVPIEISETFVLPSGQEYYQFPLLQGAEGNELQYEVYLKSPSFPLKTDVPCRLVMTFTFGDDEPYRLAFVPLNPTAAGLKLVHAHWQPKNESPTSPALSPGFPLTPSWDDLERYPKRDSEETSDLLDWIRDGMERLAQQAASLQQHRQIGTVNRGWKQDKNGAFFTFATCPAGSVFCHTDDFLDTPDPTAIRIGDSLSFETIRRNEGLSARWITVGSDLTSDADSRILSHKLDNLILSMWKGLRFPLLIAWGGEHSLADADCPDWLRGKVRAGADTLLALANLTRDKRWPQAHLGQIDEVADESLFLLSCLHHDAPPDVAHALIDVFENIPHSPRSLQQFYRHIGLAIGAADLPWQRDLLDKTLNTLAQSDALRASICLQILGIAVWRSAQLLDHLSYKHMECILEKLTASLAFDLDRISPRSTYQQEEALKHHLELLLGLLRTRTSNNPEIQSILAPDSTVTEHFARIVDSITDTVCEFKVPLRSRIRLTVSKLPALHSTPDLLYALRLYLTGDSGARAIQVTAVSDDE